jgi:hypothetical protein
LEPPQIALGPVAVRFVTPLDLEREVGDLGDRRKRPDSEPGQEGGSSGSGLADGHDLDGKPREVGLQLHPPSGAAAPADHAPPPRLYTRSLERAHGEREVAGDPLHHGPDEVDAA